MRALSERRAPIAALRLLLLLAATGPALAQSGHDDHDDDGPASVRLDDDARREFGVRVETAGPGALGVRVRLSGEVVVDPDRLSHVVPRVPGVAREVTKSVGDAVRAGQRLAVLESRELSELKSTYLVARERLSLAQTTAEREARLWRDRVSSEREYLAAQQALAEARIEMRAAEQKLHAIGLTDAQLESLAFDEDASFIRYVLTAPFAGVVVAKHMSPGEFVKDEESVFVVADLSRVWVELAVYQRDLPHVREGQSVRIVEPQTGSASEGVIDYLSPLLGEETRTATARVVLANDGTWRPGLFVEGYVTIDAEPAELVLPVEALQTLDGATVVFVETGVGFVPRPVEVGRTNDTHVEIADGLRVGERVAVSGVFTLKAQLEKDSFDSGHHH